MIKPNTVLFLIAASVLAVVHFLSLELYLYWRYLWLDMPMHVLGGAVVALGVFVAYDLSASLPQRWLRIIPVMSAVLIVALSWEVYEVAIGIPIDAEYVRDTLLDLCMGILGGLIGFVVGTSLHNLNKEI